MLSAIPPINMLVTVDTSSFSALNHNFSRGTATQFIMYLCHYIEIFVCYDACHLQNVLLDYIQPCRRQCTQSNNDINNNSCMLMRQEQTVNTDALTCHLWYQRPHSIQVYIWTKKGTQHSQMTLTNNVHQH